MATRLTYHDLLHGHHVRKIDGDLLLLPREHVLPIEEARALQVAGVLPAHETNIYKLGYNIFEIVGRYCDERNRSGQEPAWTESYPMSVQSRMRVHYAMTEEDVFAIVPNFPFTAASYIVLDGGFCAKACRDFNLFRLAGIKQLGFLQAPWYNSSKVLVQPLSEGSRYLHSLDVMVLATLIGHNLKLGKSDMATLRLAALTHDVGTPAGGDSVKMIDPQGLDEDANYPAITKALGIDWDDWKKWGVDRDKVFATILNQGVLGEILDVADKLAYVGRDLWMTAHHVDAGVHSGEQLGLRTLKQLMEWSPYLCGVWDSVTLSRGKVAFKDPARLAAFLRVRVLLFRELYYHPNARFGEFLMSRLLAKALYVSGKVTKKQLLQMGDSELIKLMGETYGRGEYDLVVETCSNNKARCNVFATQEQAEAFVRELQAMGNTFYLLEDNRRAIKTGTHFRVVTPHGPQAFAEAFPGDTRELTEMASILPMVHVYWLDGEPTIARDKLVELKRELGIA